MIDELRQDYWKTKVALYFFFEGAGAGCYFVAILAHLLKGPLSLFAKSGLIAGVMLVILGAIFLWLDLGKKGRFYWSAKNPKTSWIARGVILVSLFLLLGITYIANSIWPLTWLNGAYILRAVWGGITALLALAISIYPSMLLKSCKPFKLWDSSIIVVLFVMLSLLTGVAILLLVPFTTGFKLGITTEILSSLRFGLAVCNGLLLAEIITLGVYLFSLYETGSSEKASILRLIQGDLRPYFALMIVMGWILPLILIPAGLFTNSTGMITAVSLISAIFLIVGALIARYVLLTAATREPPLLPGLM